jgi:hypothetical protein
MLALGEQTAKESEKGRHEVECGNRTGLDGPAMEAVECSSIANWVN